LRCVGGGVVKGEVFGPFGLWCRLSRGGWVEGGGGCDNGQRWGGWGVGGGGGAGASGYGIDGRGCGGWSRLRLGESVVGCVAVQSGMGKVGPAVG